MREEEKEMLSFLSPSFDAVTFTTATNTAPADNGEAPSKDGSEEKAVDETTGGNGLVDERRTEKVA